jgi:hypothetical protein
VATEAIPPPPKELTAAEKVAAKAAARLEAEADAAGVAAGRMQSLAVTLDKVRHVLSSQFANDEARVAAAPPPLVALSDAEALARVSGVATRVLDAAAKAWPEDTSIAHNSFPETVYFRTYARFQA